MNRLRSFSKAYLLRPNPKFHFFKDSVHGSINFSADQYWLYRMVNTEEFWRLHEVKQMSFTNMNFPGVNHTRFEHSLGVYELLNRFIGSFLAKGYLDKNKDHKAINIALASGLLHDIGHGPLSHVFERVVKGFRHEEFGIKIISDPVTKINKILREKAAEDGLDEEFYVKEIAKVLRGKSEYGWVQSLLSSDFDVDRLDYLMRDSLHAGVSYGRQIDSDLFIQWASIKDGRLVFSPKIKNAMIHFLYARKIMYDDIYENKVSFKLEKAFAMACTLIIGKEPRGKWEWIFERDVKDWRVEDFVTLTDAEFVGNVRNKMMKLCGDEMIRKLLGYIFGIWINERGEHYECAEVREIAEEIDAKLGEMEKRENLDESMEVYFFDSKDESICKYRLCLKFDCCQL